MHPIGFPCTALEAQSMLRCSGRMNSNNAAIIRSSQLKIARICVTLPVAVEKQRFYIVPESMLPSCNARLAGACDEGATATARLYFPRANCIIHPRLGMAPKRMIGTAGNSPMIVFLALSLGLSVNSTAPGEVLAQWLLCE